MLLRVTVDVPSLRIASRHGLCLPSQTCALTLVSGTIDFMPQFEAEHKEQPERFPISQHHSA